MAITTSNSREIESSPVAERRFSPADPGPASQTVYAALADAEGVEPSELDFELYRSLDVDALDDFVRHAASSPSSVGPKVSSSPSSADDSWSLSFAVAGYEVRVESSGRVAVYETT